MLSRLPVPVTTELLRLEPAPTTPGYAVGRYRAVMRFEEGTAQAVCGGRAQGSPTHDK